MSQKLHLLQAEDRLLQVDGQTILPKFAEHLKKMLLIRGKVRAGNKYFVEVDKDERQTSKDAVHHALECGTRTEQTKRHVDELEKAKGLDDGGFGTSGPCSTP